MREVEDREPGRHNPADVNHGRTPLVMVVTPAAVGEAQAGSYAALAAAGQSLLASDLTERLKRAGVATARLVPERATDFHWGRWFTTAAQAALTARGETDAMGYAGAGSLSLLPDNALNELTTPAAGEVLANNRFSADAFVVRGDVDAALAALEGCNSDNAAARSLEDAGFAWRDLSEVPFSRFDVDTPLDLALLRLAIGLAGTRRPGEDVIGFLEAARLPEGRGLEVPRLEAIGAVMRDRRAELVVAGRTPASIVAHLETETACRIRWLIEERGMRSVPDAHPRSVLAALLRRTSPAELVAELAQLGDAVILDSRVLMASTAGSARAEAWPPEEERFASDFGDASRIETGWLRELVEAAASASVPFLLGGHALVSDGLRLLVAAAWAGR